jgi:hypothetical protein
MIIPHLADTHTAQITPETFLPLAPRPCPTCGVIDTPAIGPGSGPHYASARCASCRQFLGWVSRYPPAERQARRQQARLQAMAQKPPSQGQLDYLKALGDAGPPPANMAEASERIETLKRREVA